MSLAAVLDADVLYPARLRDLLLSVAESGLFRPLWTQRILDEMVRNILVDRPDLTAERLQRVTREMAIAFPEAMVTGHESLEAAMTNHEKDRHVLAACVRGHADVLVTRNTAHFRAECCTPFDLDVQSPDQFLLCAYDFRPEVFTAAVMRMLGRNQAPPKTVLEFVDSLTLFTPELVQRFAASR